MAIYGFWTRSGRAAHIRGETIDGLHGTTGCTLAVEMEVEMCFCVLFFYLQLLECQFIRLVMRLGWCNGELLVECSCAVWNIWSH